MNITYIKLDLKVIKSIRFMGLYVLLAVIGTPISFAQISDSTVVTSSNDSLTSASKLNLKNVKQYTGSRYTGSQLPGDKYKINFIKFGSITGATAGAFVWLHNYQRNAWWSGQRGKFHIQNDWDYAMSADKFGHFFDGAFIQRLYQGAFEWAGFKPTAAVWMGAAFSLAYMTDIEIEDGFATDWGFSPGDQIFNTLGALYPVAQHYWKPLRSFNIKWSYYPSEELRNGAKHGAFLDDYNGQTVWLSINVNDLLPKKAKKIWPDVINIVGGYGVENYTDFDKRYENFYLGFDLNWEKIIPGNSKFMLWFKNVINHFRFLPLPVLRINKHKTEYIVNY